MEIVLSIIFSIIGYVILYFVISFAISSSDISRMNQINALVSQQKKQNDDINQHMEELKQLMREQNQLLRKAQAHTEQKE